MRSNLNSIREKVAALRDALLSPDPESIEACLPALAFSEVTSDDLQELRALKQELAAVRGLIEHGEKMNRGLARILGEQISGYTPRGASEPVAGSARISIEG